MPNESESMNLRAKRIIADYDASNQHMWRQVDDEVIRIMMPHRSTDQDANVDGSRFSDDLLDPAPRLYADVLINGIVGKLTPQTSKWIKLKPSRMSGLQDQSREMKSLDQLSDLIFDILTSGNSNFYEAWTETVADAIHFGTFNQCVKEGKRRPFNFKHIPTGHYVFFLDDEGFTWKVIYKKQMTAYQIKTMLGLENSELPEKVRQACESESIQKKETKFDVYHCVERRDEHSGQLAEPNPMKREWKSEYAVSSDNTMLPIRLPEPIGLAYEDGLYTNPYKIERLIVLPGQSRGEGITTMYLPLIRACQHRESSKAKAIDSIVEPAWLMPEGYPHDRTPNEDIYFDPTWPDSIPKPILNPSAVEVAQLDSESIHAMLREVYYVNLFKMFTNQDIATTPKTAFEAQQIKAEQLSLIINIVKRLVGFLSQIVEEVIVIMERQSILDEGHPFNEIKDALPPIYEIEVTSQLAKALEGDRRNSFINFVQLAMELDPVFPALKHVVDVEQEVREISLDGSMNPANIRDKKQVTDFVDQERKRVQMMQIAEMANMAGDAASKFAKTGQ